MVDALDNEGAYKNNIPNKEKIIKLVRDLDKNPDKLHMDITPSVTELGKMDPTHIIVFLKEALLSKNEFTRLHAQSALSYSLSHHFGFQIGKGWTTPKGEEVMREVWIANGDYKFDSSEKQRKTAVEKWVIWSITVD